MKADLTRNTFNHFKHYTRVLMQQGRVQLDSDWNEQTSILLHYLQTLAADLIGPAGGPAAHCGFTISTLMPNTTPPVAHDFRIGPGRYYVDGILCEIDSNPIGIIAVPPAQAAPAAPENSIVVLAGTWSLDGAEPQKNQYVEVFDDIPKPAFPPTMAQISDTDKKNMKLTLKMDSSIDISRAGNPKLRRVITYANQLDYPPPFLPAETYSDNITTYQVYLDVWERDITYVQDDHIREVALGGPDTAIRSKIVCQVKVMPPTGATNNACMSVQELNDFFQPENRGKLRAMAKQVSPSTDPCIISPEASYTGPENQLYRIEIHTGGSIGDSSPPPTFKWSRENGAVFFPIVSGGDTNEVVVESLGRDDRFGLKKDDWVEIQDDWSVLHNYAGNLRQVQAVDRSTMKVTLSGPPDSRVGGSPAFHPLLRRWDQAAGDPEEGGLTIEADGAAQIVESTDAWLVLEDGVQIQFQPPENKVDKNRYRTGDYWLIPARTATGDVEWPKLIDPKGNLETDARGNAVPLPLPPQGILHHYAPLAVITLDNEKKINVDPNPCRQTFGPLAKGRGLA